MGIFGTDVVKYKNQDYSKLKKECQAKGDLFFDPEFPAQDKALFFTSGKLTGVTWKRPKDICENPKLFVAGTSSGDVTQGRLGNCWFVAASSCLALHKELCNQVIPSDQEWDENNPDEYCGIFRFKLWRYGKWTEVVIDDQLPTINGELVFIHSQAKNEFWSALLEKAYAKLFGCYECLDGGDLGEALEDFTGGVSEQLNMADIGVVDNPEEQTKFFERLKKEVDRKSLLAASIPAESSEEMEASTAMGLVKGHAYGITAVKNISLESGMFSFLNKNKIQMIRLRNPWGQGEWTGAFSDNDPEWNKIPIGEREKAGIVFEEDGEFWMNFDDFCHHFVNVSYCRVVNTSMFSLSKTWHEGIAHSAWKTPDLAGGCLNNKETFLKNPQFVFSITDDEDDCMMQLMQKSERSQQGSGNTTIGFTIMKVEENRHHRIHDHTYQEVIKNTVFRDSRSIFQKLKLDKGRYLVLACTFDPAIQQEFLFRIYTGAANEFKELHHDKPQRSFWNCCAKQPVMLTQVKVLKAEGLEKQERDGADPYCIIKCEGQKVTTSVKNDTCNPEWKQGAIFFRKNPLKNPIKVQIWNSNILKDTYMGKHLFISADECTRSIQSVGLVGRGKQGDQIRSGKLIVEITQTKTLDAI
ncbi:calpain-5-like [Mercenaria mercenaria]|uniref:calpain-5-like n=1 Tax=Mercenaria mercenaria TaxID=6596 RepID=UPI00234EA1BA|nr:calpain-5-like [Mercenaria mercenaria]